jgi:hypothetical protein
VKPWIHAKSSAKNFGGVEEDYIAIHQLMDSSKGALGDVRHRALTHNTWFLSVILEKIFGVTIKNSAGKEVSVRDIGEQHVMEDYRMKFIPTAQDFLSEMKIVDWMDNAKSGIPDSMKNVIKKEIVHDNRKKHS